MAERNYSDTECEGCMAGAACDIWATETLRCPTMRQSDQDEPYQCPECGVADAAYSVHERGCPSGYPTLEATGE